MDQLEQRTHNQRGFRRLSLTLTAVGAGALAATIGAGIQIGFDAFRLSAVLASAVFLLSNGYFALIRLPQPWMPALQAVEIAAIGLVAAVLSDPETYGGIILFAMAVLLLAKHRLVGRRVTMIQVLVGAIVLDAVLSYIVHRTPVRVMVAMGAISFGVYAIVYYAFYDEIIALLQDVSHLQRSAELSEEHVIKLRRDLARSRVAFDNARAHVEELEHRAERIGAVTTPVEFEQFKISERQVEVLRLLVETRGRNRDIAASLGITERTVKSHIYRICNRVGLDSRLELVELFRWNWPQNDDTDDMSG